MDRMKKIIIWLLCLALVGSPLVLPAAAGEESRSTEIAEALRELGLFQGVGDTQNGAPRFELDRGATRTEALVMLIRVLGMDSRARSAGKSHPFTDTPAWADGYISYAYEQGLTKGVSDTLLGAKDTVTREQYLTMLLRALGYSDGEQGDFSWDSPYAQARWKGILPEEADGGEFMRGDVVSCTCAALFASMKGTDCLLWERLAEQGVFPEEKLRSVFPEDPFSYLRGSGFTARKESKFDTYDEALLWAKNTLGADAEVMEADGCTVLWGNIYGLPRHDARLYLIYGADSGPGEGTVIALPLATENVMGGAILPDEIKTDGQTLTYIYDFGEKLISNSGDTERVRREAGRYEFTVERDSAHIELKA